MLGLITKKQEHHQSAMSHQNLLKIAINTLIGLILVVLWLKLVNLGEVVATLKTVQISYLTIFVAFFIASTVLRSIRIKILLKTYQLRLSELTKLTFLSQFLSFIIPIRAGEIAKGIYLHNQYQIPLSQVIIWILLDRFFDFWTIILLICLTFPFVHVNLPSQFYLLVFAFFTLINLIAGLILINPFKTKKVLDSFRYILLFKSLQKIYLGITEKIISGFSIYRKNIFDLPKLIFISILAIISDSLAWFGILGSLNINLTYLYTLFGNLLSTLTFLIPAAPGYIGSAEGSGLLVFAGILGLERNLASAAILLNHLMILIILPIFGLASLYLLKFNLNLVWKKLRNK